MVSVSRRGLGRLAAGLTAAAGGMAVARGPATAASGQGVDVGFVLSHEQFGTAELVGQAQAAGGPGFSYVWASDHIQPWQDDQGHAMFPWLTLALVSQATERIGFGSGVTCPIHRYQN